jgi:hypothetical protein
MRRAFQAIMLPVSDQVILKTLSKSWSISCKIFNRILRRVQLSMTRTIAINNAVTGLSWFLPGARI